MREAWNGLGKTVTLGECSYEIMAPATRGTVLEVDRRGPVR